MKPLHFLHLYYTLAFLITSGLAWGQMAIKSNPGLAGLSAERLERYDQYLEAKVKDGEIPGAVSLVFRNGQLAHEHTYGYRDFTKKEPIGADALFQIMSMTKPIITAAFMMLYEEGHFFLTDAVSKYLPQFKELKVAKDPQLGLDTPTDTLATAVTIHQLLTHTAGFSHGLGGSKLDNETARALYFSPQESIKSRVDTLVNIPMIGQPGEQWYYSASPDVLALLIEHFSGMNTAQFLERRIFNPLGMADTGYNVPAAKQDRVVLVHNFNEDGKLVPSEEQYPLEGNTVYGGTHGLFSTASDYLKFCQMMLNKGTFNGQQLLSPKTVELMTMDHVGELYSAPGQGFGLGFGVTTDLSDGKALGSVGQYYWSGAWCTYFFVDPQADMIAVLLTQIQPYSNFYGNKMRQLLYQAITE